MTTREKRLMELLSNEGICCGSCRFYNRNAKSAVVRIDACLCAQNKQPTVYDLTYFVPINESFMCEKWLDVEDEEKHG